MGGSAFSCAFCAGYGNAADIKNHAEYNNRNGREFRSIADLDIANLALQERLESDLRAYPECLYNGFFGREYFRRTRFNVFCGAYSACRGVRYIRNCYIYK